MDIPISLFAFVAASVPICIEDWRRLRIPNVLLALGAIAVGGAFSIPAAAVPKATGALLGALYAGGVLEATRRLTGGALGAGDVKYGLLLGLAAGPSLVPPILLSASGAAALYILHRGGGPVPFAPFIAGSAALGCLIAIAGGVA